MVRRYGSRRVVSSLLHRNCKCSVPIRNVVVTSYVEDFGLTHLLIQGEVSELVSVARDKYENDWPFGRHLSLVQSEKICGIVV